MQRPGVRGGYLLLAGQQTVRWISNMSVILVCQLRLSQSWSRRTATVLSAASPNALMPLFLEQENINLCLVWILAHKPRSLQMNLYCPLFKGKPESWSRQGCFSHTQCERSRCGLIVQCEHNRHELWPSYANNWLLQYNLELNRHRRGPWSPNYRNLYNSGITTPYGSLLINIERKLCITLLINHFVCFVSLEVPTDNNVQLLPAQLPYTAPLSAGISWQCSQQQWTHCSWFPTLQCDVIPCFKFWLLS